MDREIVHRQIRLESVEHGIREVVLLKAMKVVLVAARGVTALALEY